MKVGDVVHLKSGGPDMTIAKIENGYAVCEWFEGAKPMRHEFPLTSLEKDYEL